MPNMPHWPRWWWNNRSGSTGNFEELLKLLDNPQDKLPPIIHVAGTNGKGSLVSIVKSIFVNNRYRVHAYTSPHILSFNERICLSNERISDRYLFEILEHVRLIYEKHNFTLSFFESITAAAFLAFSEIPADILILETGIGGRLDATNIIKHPLISAINTIDFDHTNVLGESLQEIAFEKAGIIKNNSTLVLGIQNDQVYDLLFQYAEHRNNRVFAYEYDYIAEKECDRFTYKSQSLTINNLEPSLQGDHQILNSALAIAICENLSNNFTLSPDKIATGIKKAFYPGRIHKIDIKFFPGYMSQTNKLYVDAAHNIGGARALAGWLQNYKAETIFLIIGMTRQKNVKDFISQFKNIDAIYCVPVFSEAASYTEDELYDQISKYTQYPIYKHDNLEKALSDISLTNKNATIVVTGSIYLISDLFKFFNVTI